MWSSARTTIVLYSCVHTAQEIYLNKDPLFTQYCLQKVPVGIVLDYIEENQHLFETKLNTNWLVDLLRQRYTDPAILYDPYLWEKTQAEDEAALAHYKMENPNG